ncbi:TonB-dependent receptor plug domain-containing protein [Tenacibaculum finnmarkense]|uniref:TonB-dependent receptor plug domain-containing protein n=1 Tax=Tenacibaculum finnmarkense TaxID=2781243 RepID=UPI001EFAC24B|nr:TonB-dependent receptor [Tenacibaculum finnmarkense]MCG8206254.1 TonB-dependent receptor [Tenacibaculum finnmarkense genomovar finnmarkense]MCG8722245.1 TonB-dependent receptor [Tenacibaculum finnmarkense]MCG8740624.1 TonB-dependent receptor [Tenacibaculum finnmarkense]MCG8763913.1 TonB-dependent receptor [Tenacibaculum finnmarkense]MCG8776716.1 TonB-dependent receptor [Tenacibaculum finnmarkense]
MKKRVLYLSVLTAIFAFNVNAQQKEKTIKLEEVVITDSKFELKRENSGKVVHQITAETIQNNQGKNLVDLINTVAGIEINGNTSSSGKDLGFFVRGGSTKEVVILIDGVQVANPAGISGGYDLRLLDLNAVASVEIIKGAASTLYGSGATTAVVNITLKEAKSGVVNTNLALLVGTDNSQDSENGTVIQSNATVNGKVNKFDYLVGFSALQSNGFSQAESENEAIEFNNDPFKRISTNLKVGYKFDSRFSVKAFGSYNSFDNNYDAGPFADGNEFSEDVSYRVGVSPEYNYGNGSIHINAAYSEYKTDRTQTSYPGKSNGENYIVDAFVKHKLDNFYLLAGVNYQDNSIETFAIPYGGTELTKTVYTEKPQTTLIDPYVNAVYVSDYGVNFNAGVRLNNHNKYGNHFVYNLNPSYTLKQSNGYLKFLASYSTAFLAPSVQELYASWGNIDLNPQESTTYEGGLEYKLNSFVLNAVYFNRDVANIIAYNSTTFKMANLGDTTVKGVEFSANYNVLKGLQLNANYAFTENDAVAIRIPTHKVNAGVNYRYKATNVGVNYQFVSDRDDTDFRTYVNTTLESYSLLDFSINHKLNDNVNIMFDVTNILNEDYQEVLGYSTKGRNFKLGVGFNF